MYIIDFKVNKMMWLKKVEIFKCRLTKNILSSQPEWNCTHIQIIFHQKGEVICFY